MAVVVFYDVTESVNYASIRVSAGSIEYACTGRATTVKFDEILKLALAKEGAMLPDLDVPLIETQRFAQTGNSPWIEVTYE